MEDLEFRFHHESWAECYGELSIAARFIETLKKRCRYLREENERLEKQVQDLQLVNQGFMLKAGRMGHAYQEQLAECKRMYQREKAENKELRGALTLLQKSEQDQRCSE